jgi:hypothetical protein
VPPARSQLRSPDRREPWATRCCAPRASSIAHIDHRHPRPSPRADRVDGCVHHRAGHDQICARESTGGQAQSRRTQPLGWPGHSAAIGWAGTVVIGSQCARRQEKARYVRPTATPTVLTTNSGTSGTNASPTTTPSSATQIQETRTRRRNGPARGPCSSSVFIGDFGPYSGTFAEETMTRREQTSSQFRRRS